MAERDDDDDDSDNANDDVDVEKMAADVATGCNIVHDDWYVTIAYDTFATPDARGTFPSDVLR